MFLGVSFAGRPLTLALTCCVTLACPCPSLGLPLLICNMTGTKHVGLRCHVCPSPGTHPHPQARYLVPERPALPPTLPMAPLHLPALGIGKSSMAAMQFLVCLLRTPSRGKPWVCSCPNLGPVPIHTVATMGSWVGPGQL